MLMSKMSLFLGICQLDSKELLILPVTLLTVMRARSARLRFR